MTIHGAAVLCWLGVQSLWTLRRTPAPTGFSRPGGHGFVVGVASSLGNPKAGVVAVSLIPQFVTTGGPVLVSSIALGAIWVVVSGIWFSPYVWAVDKGSERVTRPATQRVLQAATGVTMLGLGVASGDALLAPVVERITAEVAAGRMSFADAGAAFRDSVLRVCRR